MLRGGPTGWQQNRLRLRCLKALFSSTFEVGAFREKGDGNRVLGATTDSLIPGGGVQFEIEVDADYA